MAGGRVDPGSAGDVDEDFDHVQSRLAAMAGATTPPAAALIRQLRARPPVAPPPVAMPRGSASPRRLTVGAAKIGLTGAEDAGDGSALDFLAAPAPAPAPTPAPSPTFLEKLSEPAPWERKFAKDLATPAPWERRTAEALAGVLRKASTPAKWERAASGKIGALVAMLRGR